jgi:hypothetical protein
MPYKENFIAGIRHLMADHPELDTVKAAAGFLGINYMSLHKIMDGTNSPTIAQCITLCEKAGYNANWLLLNQGEIYYKQEVNMEKLFAELKGIRDEMAKWG